MTKKVVEAIVMQDVGKSTFKAIYGRHVRGDTTYTKYFLQLNVGCRKVLEELIPLTGVVEPGGFRKADISLVWPDGSATGHLQETTDARLQLHWSGVDGTPEPWRLGVGEDHPSRRLPGDDSYTERDEADRVFDDEITPVGAVLLALKLQGERNRLHLRVAMKNPPPEGSDTGFDRLPPTVRDKAEEALGTSGCKAWAGTEPTRATALVKKIDAALERSPNVLIVGPPGTGKTVALEDVRRRYEHGEVYFDPDTLYDNWDEIPTGKTRSVVFHPSYHYEDFVIRLTPEVSDDDTSGAFRLKAEPGPLMLLAHYASAPSRRALMLLDEFNRGNASAIFGDTLALLDKDKRHVPSVPDSGESISRPFPNMTIEVPEEFANPSGRTVPQEFKLPLGLQVIAALNSSDRSVAPLDAALRRRFRIIRSEPDLHVLRHHFGIEESGVLPNDVPDGEEVTVVNVQELALRLLSVLNHRVRLILGEDFLLGHALLWDVVGDRPDVVTYRLAAAFDQQLVATLRMTLIDQDDALAAILNISEASEYNAATADVGGWEMPDASLREVADRRLRLRELASLTQPEHVWRALEDIL